MKYQLPLPVVWTSIFRMDVNTTLPTGLEYIYLGIPIYLT